MVMQPTHIEEQSRAVTDDMADANSHAFAITQARSSN